MNLFQETKFIMDKYNIKANKSLGQNFLINENIVNGIVESADVNSKDLIIEIGPGLGTLTHRLLENAGKVIAIELDKKVIDILTDRFSYYNNFELINDDVLKVNLNELINKNLDSQITNCKIVANLPYYITTPIIMKLLQERLPLHSITVMVQKEVANRLTSLPGTKDAGAITYSIYYFADSKIVLNVPKSSFIPAPEVESSVIQLNLLQEPRVKVNDEKIFFDIIKASFSQKRKTLVNGLLNNGIVSSRNEAEKLLSSCGLDLQIRGEKLTIQDFANLANKLA